MYKKEIRIIGIDDAPFNKFKKGNVLVVGTMFRGGSWIDGLLSTKIAVDGNNSTSKLIRMVNKSKFKPQLQCIILDGIALGGFNIVDVEKLHKKTRIPVLVVIRRMPDFKRIESALKKLNKSHKYKLIQKAGPVHKIGKIYVQLNGLTLEQAKQILRITCTHSLLPEPIRVAHLIAAGVVRGESKGNA
ncbi:DUF99 family protein [Candidatus Woesearchaeota archaeon]|nr:DUF99 family protein [Candidatus Woesearchaeota archaeon]